MRTLIAVVSALAMITLVKAAMVRAEDGSARVEQALPKDGGYRPDPRGNQFNRGNPAENVYDVPSSANAYPEEPKALPAEDQSNG